MRCVIFGAAPINNYEKIKACLRTDDFIICADAGLQHAIELNIKPDLIIGDFDSYNGKVEFDSETITLPRMKDDTDTAAAVKEGLQRGFNEFCFFGVLGGRVDHSLVNLYLLEFLNINRAKGKIIDDYSEMFLLKNDSVTIEKKDNKYFSIIAYNGKAEGVYIEGAVYPLKNAVINPSYQYGVSNEFAEPQVKIEVKNGSLLVIIS